MSGVEPSVAIDDGQPCRWMGCARLQATHLGLWRVQETQKKDVSEELSGRQGMTKDQLETAFPLQLQKVMGSSGSHTMLQLARNCGQGSLESW